MTTSQPKRRAPRLMGIAVENRKMGLAVIDPWELRGAITLNLRQFLEDLKLQIFSFAAQEKPKIIVIEEKDNTVKSKQQSLITKLIRAKNLDTFKVKRQDSMKHLSAITTTDLQKRLKKLFGEATAMLDTPTSVYACANALFAIHTQEFPSRTYVKPTPRSKNSNPDNT